MSDIPEDISEILLEIDQCLKDGGYQRHQRSMNAVIEFGRRFNIKIPLVPLSPNIEYSDRELEENNRYTIEIYRWFSEMYGASLAFDPSQKSKVAVLARGDIWELPLPLYWGSALITLSRDFFPQQPLISANPVLINPCQELVNLTPKLLKLFSDDDLNEVSEQYNLGEGARAAFEKFKPFDRGFVEAENDWAAAVLFLTLNSPAYGQAWWSSAQMAEKFMKSILRYIGRDDPAKIEGCKHNLGKLHDMLDGHIQGVGTRHLASKAYCSPDVRYGKAPASMTQAYDAHKAALGIVAAWGRLQKN